MKAARLQIKLLAHTCPQAQARGRQGPGPTLCLVHACVGGEAASPSGFGLISSQSASRGHAGSRSPLYLAFLYLAPLFAMELQPLRSLSVCMALGIGLCFNSITCLELECAHACAGKLIWR